MSNDLEKLYQKRLQERNNIFIIKNNLKQINLNQINNLNHMNDKINNN